MGNLNLLADRGPHVWPRWSTWTDHMDKICHSVWIITRVCSSFSWIFFQKKKKVRIKNKTGLSVLGWYSGLNTRRRVCDAMLQCLPCEAAPFSGGGSGAGSEPVPTLEPILELLTSRAVGWGILSKDQPKLSSVACSDWQTKDLTPFHWLKQQWSEDQSCLDVFLQSQE